MKKSVFQTEFADLKLVNRGKVRDIYDLEDSLLMVTTDRLSAFDVILPDPIPEKGKILTQIAIFWFEKTKNLIKNHLISGDVKDYPSVCKPYEEILQDRSMLVRKANPIPIECIVRGYVSGSGWKSYLDTKTICGIRLPDGLVESDKLPEPIFTPSTKADIGDHDININFDETVNIIGKELAEKIKDLSLKIYEEGRKYAEEKGIIIADTKFEFGLLDGEVILIDEVLTPDSSRFWPKNSYRPGGSQQSFDKQYVRDYLSSITWDKNPPGPKLPEEVIKNTQSKYLEALNLLKNAS